MKSVMTYFFVSIAKKFWYVKRFLLLLNLPECVFCFCLKVFAYFAMFSEMFCATKLFFWAFWCLFLSYCTRSTWNIWTLMWCFTWNTVCCFATFHVKRRFHKKQPNDDSRGLLSAIWWLRLFFGNANGDFRAIFVFFSAVFGSHSCFFEYAEGALDRGVKRSKIAQNKLAWLNLCFLLRRLNALRVGVIVCSFFLFGCRWLGI